jgi:nucleotide-binding universal stress UspA family protein
MMKKILVPTDFSTSAQYASDYAMHLANLNDAEVLFLHIMPIPVDWIPLNHDQEKFYPDVSKKVRKAQSNLNALTDKAVKLGVRSQSYLHYNDTYQYITNYAENNNFDLITMGFRGTNRNNPFFGSNTNRVVRSSNIPVLMISQPITEIKKIGFFSDFDKESHGIAKTLNTFTMITKAELYLVFINTAFNFFDSDTIQDRIDEFSEKLEYHTGYIIHNDHSIQLGIDNVCKKKNIDLIVMAPYGKTSIDRLFYGSYTESVINHTNKSILSIPMSMAFSI